MHIYILYTLLHLFHYIISNIPWKVKNGNRCPLCCFFWGAPRVATKKHQPQPHPPRAMLRPVHGSPLPFHTPQCCETAVDIPAWPSVDANSRVCRRELILVLPISALINEDGKGNSHKFCRCIWFIALCIWFYCIFLCTGGFLWFFNFELWKARVSTDKTTEVAMVGPNFFQCHAFLVPFATLNI